MSYGRDDDIRPKLSYPAVGDLNSVKEKARAPCHDLLINAAHVNVALLFPES